MDGWILFYFQGYYVIMKKRKNHADAALINENSIGSKCLSFWYHMKGKRVGTLSVQVDNKLVLLLEGSRNNAWKKVQIKINAKKYVSATIKMSDISFTIKTSFQLARLLY